MTIQRLFTEGELEWVINALNSNIDEYESYMKPEEYLQKMSIVRSLEDELVLSKKSLQKVK